jgi:hypothetical protein
MMQMLYDSETFVVVHVVANEPFGLVPHDPYEKPRHGFEIVDKRVNKEVYLDGPWAAAFQAQMTAWQLDKPQQSEVGALLEDYCTLAQIPLALH